MEDEDKIASFSEDAEQSLKSGDDCKNESPPNNPHDSVRRCVTSCIMVFASFLSFMLVAVLAVDYAAPSTRQTIIMAKEDIPKPDITICFKMEYMVRKNLLKDYGVENIDLNTTSWETFPWGEVDLKEFYDEVLMKPNELISRITVNSVETCGNCSWKHFLQSDETCSTLSIYGNLPQSIDYSIRLYISEYIANMDLPSIYVHEKENPFSVHKSTIFLQGSSYDTFSDGDNMKLRSASLKVKITKKERVTGTFQNWCNSSVEYRHNKELDSCIENDLLKNESDCVLPWMINDGRVCEDLFNTRRMIEKLKLYISTPCKPLPPCHEWFYEVDDIDYQRGDSLPFYYEVLIPSHNLVTKEVEEWKESVFDSISPNKLVTSSSQLTADIGGSLGIIWDISLIVVYNVILAVISAIILWFFKQTSSYQKCKHIVEKAVECISSLLYAVTALFCVFLTFTLLWNYVNDTKILVRESGTQIEYRYPTISFCNKNYGKKLFSKASKHEQSFNFLEKLQPNYNEFIRKSPFYYLKSCRLNTINCEDAGLKVKTSKFTEKLCESIDTSVLDTSKQNFITFSFNEKFLSGAGKYDLILSDQPLATYDKFHPETMLVIQPVNSIDLTFSVQKKMNLEPCNPTHLQCLETCVNNILLDYLLKQKDCKTPSTVHLNNVSDCETFLQYFKSVESLNEFESAFSEASCKCSVPCLQTNYLRQDLTIKPSTLVKIGINLKSRFITEEREEHLFDLTKFLMVLGGTLGVMLGFSVPSMIETILSNIMVYGRKNIKIVILYNVLRTAVSVGLWIWYIYLIYGSLSHYLSSPVSTSDTITVSDTMLVPDISLCMKRKRIGKKGRFEAFRRWRPTEGDDFGLEECNEMIDLFGDQLCYNVTDTYVADVISLGEYTSQYRIWDSLFSCTVWGHDCLSDSGPFHSWHTVTNVNGFCSTLKLKASENEYHLINKIEIAATQYKEYEFHVYVGDENHPLTEYNFVTPDQNVRRVRQVVTVVPHHFELLDNPRGRCVQTRSYSRGLCLEKCHDERIARSLNCTLPWMKSIQGVRYCNDTASISLGITMVSQLIFQRYGDYYCDCPDDCSFTLFEINQLSRTTGYFRPTFVMYISQKMYSTSSSWAYTFVNLWSDLGGIGTLLTGSNIMGFQSWLNEYLKQLL